MGVFVRNADQWQPTKFVQVRGRWRASRNAVGPGSRLVADILADTYVRALQRHARGRLLDLGCGSVPLYGAYRDLVDETCCADWAATRHGSPYLDYEIDLNAPVPLPDFSFDTVVATDLMEHIAYPDRLFREISRLLRPGGKLILGVPFFYRIHEAPHDYYRFTAFCLRRFCEDHRLDVLELAPYGGSPEIVSDLIGKHLIAASNTLAEIHLWLSRQVLRLPFIRALSTATADSYPLGYCLVAQRPLGVRDGQPPDATGRALAAAP